MYQTNVFTVTLRSKFTVYQSRYVAEVHLLIYVFSTTVQSAFTKLLMYRPSVLFIKHERKFSAISAQMVIFPLYCI